jgi:hypothetical protein
MTSPYIERTVIEETKRRNIHLKLLIERGISQEKSEELITIPLLYICGNNKTTALSLCKQCNKSH